MTDVRRQMTDVRGQRSDVRRQREMNSEVGMRKLELFDCGLRPGGILDFGIRIEKAKKKMMGDYVDSVE
jgi:hypothetical protein